MPILRLLTLHLLKLRLFISPSHLLLSPPLLSALTLLLFSVAITTPASAIELNTNLMPNGDFNENLLHWQTEHPTRLAVKSGQHNSNALLLSVDHVDSGRRFNDNLASTCIDTAGAAAFFFEANQRYLRLPTKQDAQRVEFVWYRETGCEGGGNFGTYLEPKITDQWQRLSKNLRPTLGAKSLKITLRQSSRSAIAQHNAWQSLVNSVMTLIGRQHNPIFVEGLWDNLVLIATKEHNPFRTGSEAEELAKQQTPQIGDNYLSNGGLDKPPEFRLFNHTGNEVVWTKDVGHKAPGAIRTTIVSDGSSLGSSAFTLCINIGLATKFAAGAFYQAHPSNTQSGSARLRVVWHSQINCKGQQRISNTHATPTANNNWQKLYMTHIQPPEGTLSIALEAIHTISGKGRYTAHWDDIYFTPTE